MITVRSVAFDAPAARALWDAQQADLLERYGVPDVDAEIVADGVIASLVGFRDDEPVACVMVRWPPYDVAAGTAEVKRLFVVRGERGRGYSRVLMDAVEEAALHAGAARVVIETGEAQPEAIGLYRALGYADIPAYGTYKCHPDSVCMGKELARATAAPPAIRPRVVNAAISGSVVGLAVVGGAAGAGEASLVLAVASLSHLPVVVYLIATHRQHRSRVVVRRGAVALQVAAGIFGPVVMYLAWLLAFGLAFIGLLLDPPDAGSGFFEAIPPAGRALIAGVALVGIAAIVAYSFAAIRSLRPALAAPAARERLPTFQPQALPGEPEVRG